MLFGNDYSKTGLISVLLAFERTFVATVQTVRFSESQRNMEI